MPTTATTTAMEENNPNELNDLTLTQKMAKQLLGMRIAHEAVMLDDANNVLALNRGAIKRTLAIDPTKETGEANAKDANAELDEMASIHVGDIVQHYTGATNTRSEGDKTTPLQSVTPTPSKTSTLAKIAGVAALLGAGSAIPLGVSAISSMLADKKPETSETGKANVNVVPIVPTLKDTDTQYEFDLSSGDVPK